MSKKIVIIGAKGMLGKQLAEIFAGRRPVLLDKKDLDITRQSEVEKTLLRIQPGVVINSAAYTAVDEAEKNRALARRVNGLAVGYLVSACLKTNSILVHFSTDYVFSGKDKKGYTERSKPDKPLNVYGRSKLLGEKYILRAKGLKFFLVRTSWLFGPGAANFVTKMLSLAEEKNQISVVNDQFGRPTYTKDLAESVRKLLEESFPFGVYHITNATTLSWYEFAKLIFQIKKEFNPAFSSPKIFPVTSEEWLSPARRPHFSVLINTKFPPLRPVQEALRDYLKPN